MDVGKLYMSKRTLCIVFDQIRLYADEYFL